MNMHVDSATIDVDELRSLLEARVPVTVLDVRKAEDRTEWSIPSSVHFDAYEALKAGDLTALADVDFPIDAPIVTVCGGGHVSLTAMEQLRKRGYHVRSLFGGMKAWSLAWNDAVVPVPRSKATVIQIRRTGKGCLSYLIGNYPEAIVIDAALSPEIYQDLAAARGWTITDVVETHVHADHLSRARSLAEATDATLRLPAQDRVSFDFSPIRDGDAIAIGPSRLVAIHTPGHTLESTSYLLDHAALFSGDTLFLDGVGRPDLEASLDEARSRARLLHTSLMRLLALPADVVILPGHTRAPAPFDKQPIAATLAGVTNGISMLAMNEVAFVTTILARIPPTPPNHAQIVAFNEAGRLPEGDPTDLEAGANRCAVS